VRDIRKLIETEMILSAVDACVNGRPRNYNHLALPMQLTATQRLVYIAMFFLKGISGVEDAPATCSLQSEERPITCLSTSLCAKPFQYHEPTIP
jgi:hypothetical protein